MGQKIIHKKIVVIDDKSYLYHSIIDNLSSCKPFTNFNINIINTNYTIFQIKCNEAQGAEAYNNRRATSNDVTVKNGNWYHIKMIGENLYIDFYLFSALTQIANFHSISLLLINCMTDTKSKDKCNKEQGEPEAYNNRRATSNDGTVKNGTWYDIPVDLQKHIRQIISMRGVNFGLNEIIFTPPINLNYIINLVHQNLLNKNLFESINDNLVYHEQESLIRGLSHNISLTDKENKIIKNILNSDDRRINLQDLTNNIWQHLELYESNAVETHLYRLKHKLPPNILTFNSKFCSISYN